MDSERTISSEAGRWLRATSRALDENRLNHEATFSDPRKRPRDARGQRRFHRRAVRWKCARARIAR